LALDIDSARQRWQVVSAFFFTVDTVPQQGLIAGIGLARKTQIAECVFMRAAHLRVARQRSELGQGLVHLCGGALKQATAATREQSVTTE